MLLQHRYLCKFPASSRLCFPPPLQNSLNRVALAVLRGQELLPLKVAPIQPSVTTAFHHQWRRDNDCQMWELLLCWIKCRKHKCLHFLWFLNTEMPAIVWLVDDNFMKWKHFPCYWPFVWGIHWSPMNSSHKGQWCGALIFLWSAPEWMVE